MIGYVVTWETGRSPGHGVIDKHLEGNYYWVVVDGSGGKGVKINAGSFKSIHRPETKQERITT